MKLYLCGVSFQHELGECSDIHFYDSLDELKQKSKCYAECGVVELDVDDKNDPETYNSFKWVVKQNLFWGKK
jgi:hypothetical protein